MTDKEKAKAYDEALEKARKYRDEEGFTEMEDVFPELRESEDERIRKELIEAFEAYDVESSWNLIPVKHILAWLEKQKENPKSADSIPADCTLDVKCEGCSFPDWKMSSDYPEEGCNVSLNGEVKKIQEQKPSCWNSPVMTHEMIMEKQKEQKPIPDWMPKFLDELRSKKNYFDWDEHRDFEGHILAIINWITPNYFEEKEQKPVEWSEEDEKMFHQVLRYLDPTLPRAKREEIELWLKALRPSWKPSEEQMEALERASTNKYLSAKQFDILVSLYEQLSKRIRYD